MVNYLLIFSMFKRKCLIVNNLRRCQSSLSIVFYGSDAFSLSSLEKLSHHLVDSPSPELTINRLEVVTKNDRNHVSQFAKNKGLMVHHWPCRLKPDTYDLGVVVSFGQLIDSPSIRNCKYGMINVHPSLLPKYRGSTPIQRAVLNGDQETGVSVVTIEPKKFDIGKILSQERVAISESTKSIDLYHNLAEIGSSLLMKCLTNIEYYLSNSIEQSTDGVSYATKLKKCDGYIDWETMTSCTIDKIYRAYDSFIPIYCDWINGSPLILMEMVDYRDTVKLDWDKLERLVFGCIHHDKPGLVMFNPRLNGICFKCKDNKWVTFRQLALKNYGKMTALDFKNGFVSKQKQPLIISNNRK